MFTTKLGSRLKVVSGRHTVLILFAQSVDDRIKDFSVANKFTSGIDLRHLDLSSISLESQSAFQCLFPGSSQFFFFFFFFFLDKIFRPKNCVIEARETYIKSLYATQLEILQRTYSSR